MPSEKTIKRRLTSVKTTKKIIKAMNMVAASKLQKDKARLEAARPFFTEVMKVMDGLKNREDTADNLFLKPRAVKNIVYLIITSDRGLCGGYNVNLAEKALAHMNENEGKNKKIIAMGLKGYSFFKRHGFDILRRYDNAMETAFYEDAERIGRFITRLYASGGADEVYAAYTEFESALTHHPRIERILPVSRDFKTENTTGDMKYESDPSVFMDHVIPVYLNAFIYNALLESSACEQAARMLSMDAAANNASDILDKLTRVYNRSRQSAITQEISEVAGGTNISKQGSGSV